MDGIRTVLMRGGTSRGLVVAADELPAAPDERQRVVAGLFGSGTAGQIDGVGGATVNTSKLAVVGPSAHPGADVDYLFGQVATDRASVDFSGTCGNLASAVALYAVQEGLAPGRVRIREVSSGQILTGDVLGEPAQRYADGPMPGTGTPIALDLAGLQGASAGQALPTGQPVQELPLPDGRTVPATVVDVGNVLAFVPASAVGLTGHERPQEIEGSPAMATLAQLRAATAVALGWCVTPQEWHDSASRLPFVALVAAPAQDKSDLVVRLYAVGRVHRAIAVTAVAACGAAAAQAGSTVREVLREPAAADGDGFLLRIGHPGGTAAVTVTPGEGGASALRYVRTARRLLEGVGFAPVG